MALPIGKQPEAQPEHSGNNAELRNAFIDSIARARHVYDRDTEHPYIRGRNRNSHVRAWLLWNRQRPPQTATESDLSLRAAPLPEAYETITPVLFPKAPWTGPDLWSTEHLDDGATYVTENSIVKALNRYAIDVMPLDAIHVQVHKYAAKIVWANGASKRFDVARLAYELERELTTAEWMTYAHEPQQLIDRLRGLPPQWHDEHEYVLTRIVDHYSNSVRGTIDAILAGREPYNAALGAAVQLLYTFEDPEPVKQWESYQDFLNSPEWQAKREAVHRRSRGFCESCRVAGVMRKAVHVHHVHYEKPWGQEDTTDLLHLCEEHHKLAHGNVS